MFDQAQHLDGKHGQDARHQVQDQTACQRRQQDQRPGAQADGGGGGRGGNGDGLLECAGAVGQGDGDGLAGEGGGLGLGIEHRQAQAGGAQPLRRAEGESFAVGLDKGIRLLQCRMGFQFQPPALALAGLDVGCYQAETGGGRCGDPAARLVDGKRVRARFGRAGGQGEGKLHMLGNADIAAGQIVQAEACGDRLARTFGRNRQRVDHVLFVADAIDAQNLKAGRGGPGDGGRGEVVGALPFQPGRVPSLARRAPIGLPAGLKLDLQAEAQLLLFADGGGRCHQPRPGFGVSAPAGRGLRPCLAVRQHWGEQGGEQDDKAQRHDGGSVWSGRRAVDGGPSKRNFPHSSAIPDCVRGGLEWEPGAGIRPLARE